MTVTLYYNQRTSGGSVDWERWEATNPEAQTVTYGDYYSLKSKDFILPEGFSVGIDQYGNDRIFNDKGYAVDICGSYEEDPHIVDYRCGEGIDNRPKIYHLKVAE
ncbi:MAG: hypothetical protein ACI4KR_12170 [Ruminiclostridium sp.]